MAEITSNLFATGARTVSSLDHARVRHEPIQWPSDARTAVVWTIIFELLETGEDAKKSLYGGRRGVWRLLDQMDRNQVKASFLVNGYAAEKFPEAVVEIKKRGHEIAGYGYMTSRRLSNMKPDEEKGEILKTLDILEKVTGSRPVGWVSPDCFPGDRTLEVLAGEGILWSGDFPNDDLPYVVKIGGKPMVIIPFSTEVDDYEIYGKNLQPPDVWADTFIDGLNVLYKEGATHPKLQHAALRRHYFGRAVGTKAVDKAIHYAKSLPKVWFATRTEIAQWWMKQQYS